MARLVAALRRTFGDSYQEPAVHFHAASNDHAEVCYVEACDRPRLKA
jgi:hypothetical protein